MPSREYFPPSQKVLPPPPSFHPLQILRALRRRNRRRPIVVPSGAPTTSEYLLLAAESLLPNARIFQVSGLLVAVDSGPAAPYDVGLDQADLILANLTDLDTELQAEYIAQALITANGDLIYRAAGVPTRLPIGNAADILTVTAGLPSWAPPVPTTIPPFQLPFQSANWYPGNYVSAATTTVSIALNQIYLIPFQVPQSTAFDRIGIEQTGAGNGNYRLGVYGPITGAIPGSALAFDAGAVAATGAGLYTITINQTLAAGWYFLALISDQTRTCRAIAQAAYLPGLGNGTQSARPDNYYFKAQTYGALPTPMPSSLSGTSGFAGPMLQLRAT